MSDYELELNIVQEIDLDVAEFARGATFIPTVSSSGVISWTNDGGLPNPEPVDIMGPQGEQGPQGQTGAQGPQGEQGPQGQTGPAGSDGNNGVTFTPTVSTAGVISWTNDGGLPNPTSVNIKGPQGQTGPAGQGVPTGGTTGQVLKKKSGTDYDTEWGDESGGGGGSGGMVVTFSYSGVYSCDKTFDEIAAAFASGEVITGKYNSNSYVLYSVETNPAQIYFKRYSIDTSQAQEVYLSVYKQNGQTKVSGNTKTLTIPSIPSYVAQSKNFSITDDGEGGWLVDAGGWEIDDAISNADYTAYFAQRAISYLDAGNTEADIEQYSLAKVYTTSENVGGDTVITGHLVFRTIIDDNGLKVRTMTISDELGQYDQFASATITFTDTAI